jgi:limonene 1,2-monooxygenase
MFGIDQVLLRDRQDEALGVIVRLLNGERITVRSDWFQINDGQLQLLPLQEKLPMAAASSISPSGMQLAGKYGMGVLSIASTSSEGLQALPVQWAFAEEAAKKHSQTVDRRNWRVLLSWHLAESKKQAQQEAVDGLWWWHNEYRVRVLGQLGATAVEDKWKLLEQVSGAAGSGAGAAVVGTPDELVKTVRHLQEITGGFGIVLGFAHDWANYEATLRSWELFARYVIPELNGYTRNQKSSAEYLAEHKPELMAGRAESIRATIKGNEKAQAALDVTMRQMGNPGAAAGAFRPGFVPTAEPEKEKA